jgi:hypothetical protein
MQDFVEYLRAYRAYISANLGWGKALRFALVWLAGMFVPLASKTLLALPNWVAMAWMIVWAFLGYIFAPYGMWKHHRTQIASSSRLDKSQGKLPDLSRYKSAARRLATPPRSSSGLVL